LNKVGQGLIDIASHYADVRLMEVLEMGKGNVYQGLIAFKCGYMTIGLMCQVKGCKPN